jgi:uncharacterized membrane protein
MDKGYVAMDLLNTVLGSLAEVLICILEVIGILIIAYSSIAVFIRYCRLRFKEPDSELKLQLAQGMTLGLEFLLAGEILHTIVARDIYELIAVGGLVIIRSLITLLLYWEIKNDTYKR